MDNIKALIALADKRWPRSYHLELSAWLHGVEVRVSPRRSAATDAFPRDYRAHGKTYDEAAKSVLSKIGAQGAR